MAGRLKLSGFKIKVTFTNSTINQSCFELNFSLLAADTGNTREKCLSVQLPGWLTGWWDEEANNIMQGQSPWNSSA